MVMALLLVLVLYPLEKPPQFWRMREILGWFGSELQLINIYASLCDPAKCSVSKSLAQSGFRQARNDTNLRALEIIWGTLQEGVQDRVGARRHIIIGHNCPMLLCIKLDTYFDVGLGFENWGVRVIHGSLTLRRRMIWAY
ncbi:hypothetical protein GLOIN_2v1480131 [Rhizophagus irregularis DAOM 181602=DAOM 197198]|uniref:Uncharacterized protein n=1 Tax=Rhizophagus irregularis (strain DAOM 181602 / DAOM 197198 / MUCL 43194) TaxID=747089 RepID=A0A2P4PV89_RHIID|nr:hypothetical protein GLOIN_2v1480131 [Rhizophagus irregularis DAOM 181602=DAOM 197198]POG69288.1 hypothetical protein GLOIN_2v1480131 [Rhizophagus irregularis DAOM 181602=DAOM 197198]|eukprot:XP_025176154.1 hypothetical protein GLOIN_2v1480131 [Rhizophagus irregularis DAOM 181602=DAOM 197198]